MKNQLSFQLSKFKFLEFGFLGPCDIYWFDFELAWSKTGDHCGLSFEIWLYKWSFFFTIRDCRHWNYEKNRFMTAEEAKKEWDEFDKKAAS